MEPMTMALIAGGLMGAGSFLGGKEANKPKRFSQQSTLVPFGGNTGIGMDILNTLLQRGQNLYFNQPTPYIGPSPQMYDIYARMMNILGPGPGMGGMGQGNLGRMPPPGAGRRGGS